VIPIARASMSVLLGAWSQQAASLACAPVTPLYCGLFFLGRAAAEGFNLTSPRAHWIGPE